MKQKHGKLASVLAATSLAWWIGYAVLRSLGWPVSRQMVRLAHFIWSVLRVRYVQANLPYVIWTAAFNTAFLLGGLLVQMGDAATHAPPLLEAINRNGLVIFLLVRLRGIACC